MEVRNDYSLSRGVVVAVRKADGVLVQRTMRTRGELAAFRLSSSIVVAHCSADVREGSPVPSGSSGSLVVDLAAASEIHVEVDNSENEIRLRIVEVGDEYY